ncbi:MAG: TolC family protein [Muribaculaceae bacterium]|nr:TolC family protein [Muribaculaceae bacterium]
MCIAVFSQTGHAGTWTLDSCINYAVAHNVNILQGELRIKEGEQAVTEAKDRFLPTLDASASQSFTFGRALQQDNTYADRNTSSFGWNVGFSLPLFQGMSEYHKLKVAKAGLRQYVLENEAAKENVSLNVISQYLQVLYAKEVAEAARSQAEYSAFEVERQKTLIEAGKVAEATLYDLESVAAQDRLQVVTAENDIRTALVNLANMLQLRGIEDFDVASISQGEPAIPEPDQVYSEALITNSSLKAARQSVSVANENISLARSGYLPTLSFNAGTGSSYYRVNGYPNDNFGDQMRHNISTYVGFSLRIPIFDGFNTRNSIRRARLQKINAELNYDQRNVDLYKEIQLAYYQAVGARERYMTAGETLEKTRMSFESTRERFNLGRATQADYEQAKNNLFRTEVSRIQAHYEYLMRHRILMFYAKM